MPAKPNERQYRSIKAVFTPHATCRGDKLIETDYYVEGYATTFDDPYVLYTDWDGNDQIETIDRHALDGADTSDVIMQFDHAGDVLARTSNGTLVVDIDEHGLFVAADLSKSAAARERYEEIANGLVVTMSWCFVPVETAYDRETHTTTILRVGKVYDVSCVSFPADPNTEISARNLLNGVIEQSRKELARINTACACARAAIAIANTRKA